MVLHALAVYAHLWTVSVFTTLSPVNELTIRPTEQCQTVGASMNLQKACPSPDDKSCQVSCQDPTSSNQCVVLQSPLIDGSPCGYGGTCNGGTCKPGSVFDTVKAWYKQNLQISIPVTVVAGVVLLVILYFVISRK